MKRTSVISLFLCMVVVALLVGMASAKLSKTAQVKLGKKPSTAREGVPHRTIPFGSKSSRHQAAAEKQSSDGGDDEDEEATLDACMAQLAELTEEEGVYEEQRDQCMEALDPLVDLERVYMEYRNHNHTACINCLLNLTECNDINDARIQASSLSARVYDESIVNHPYFAEEAKLRAAIAVLDETRFQEGMAEQRKQHTRARRETIQCTLDQCHKLVIEASFRVKGLQANISWCDAEILERRESIMSYLRFSQLYEQETELCAPILDKCQSGLRLLSITLQNGEYDNLAYQFDLMAGWIGFGNTPTNFFFQNDQPCPGLQAMSQGDSSVLIEELQPYSQFNISTDFGEGLLFRRESWNQNVEVRAEDGWLYFAFPIHDFSGNSARSFFVSPQEGLQLFDDNLDFLYLYEVLDDDDDDDGKKKKTTDEKKKLAMMPMKRQKRMDMPLALFEDCGCVGDSVTTYGAHEMFFVMTDLAVWSQPTGEYLVGSTLPNTYAALIVDELRWSLPYPDALPETIDLDQAPQPLRVIAGDHQMIDFTDFILPQ